MNLLTTTIRSFTLAVLISVINVDSPLWAQADDYVVVIKEPRSLQQVLMRELQSVTYMDQIAAYNEIESPEQPLQVGSTLAIPRPYMDSLRGGRIAYVKGDVKHVGTDTVVNPPAKGSQVFTGDIIETGPDGFVSLSFKRGARIQVQPESRVVISNINCLKADEDCVIALQATAGQISSEVTPRPEDSPQVRFSIETPYLMAAVRGTAFYVDVEEGNNRVGVTKGLVATEAGEHVNELPKGKGISVAEGAPPAVVTLLEPPVLNLSLSRELPLLSEEDEITWQELSGAENYIAEFATDEEMLEQQASEVIDARRLFTPRLAPGDYYLALAGIDAQEFNGLPAKTKVAVAEIDGEPPQLSITWKDGLTELFVPDYEGELELLISDSVNADSFDSRLLANGSDKLVLTLDPEKDWVFRARKVLGSHKVSAYSGYYVLEAR